MTQPFAADVREKYVRFFEEQGHVRIPSASLLPENDPTTLFTGSGMQPMVPYLLGQPHPLGRRLTNAQRCFRAVDIDVVGDNRHTTFFEMLGNWSLGDYFKQEQIPWVFSFLTHKLRLPAERLYVTAFRGDDAIGIPRDTQTVAVWQKLFSQAGVDHAVVDFAEQHGLQGGRIFYYDATENWWSRAGKPGNMPQGEPGGPDSEIFWDFGPARGLHEQSTFREQPCQVHCDCGRFMEIGNNVFMQYQRTASGFAKLAQPNIDFGGGLERMVAALRDDPDVYMIDVFDNAREFLTTESSHAYGDDTQSTRAMRIILDHLRAAVFLIADGALPTQKDHGYFTRRLIRRAVRYAHGLQITHNFSTAVGECYLTTYTPTQPWLEKKRDIILSELSQEEEKFRATLASGLKVFSRILSSLPKKTTLPAKVVFDLYQSYGFPMEMTEELALEAGYRVDRTAFAVAFAAHQAQSRAGAKQKFSGGLADHSEQAIKYHTATHLLHQALRDVLGSHVLQRGSNITQERLRFDFAHPAKLTAEERQNVERIVNEKISADLPVTQQEMIVAEARAAGALGVFEHKYAERVRVYSVGDYSKEICGGPHVAHTGVLGTFHITSEEAVGKGVRRIKANLT